MIPKTIHYCWFGRNTKPALAYKCIETWKDYMPDFEIIEWNEDNYDFSACPEYVKEAYKSKKWAFVSDYVRFDILHQYGGIYLDTDVELLRSLNPIISKGAFMGCEALCDRANGVRVNPGLGMAAEQGNKFLKEMIDFYNTIHFVDEKGELNEKTIVDYTTEHLLHYGLKNVQEIQKVENFIIYPPSFFCPKAWNSYKKNFCGYGKAFSVHHFSASWQSEEQKKMAQYYYRKNKINKYKSKLKDLIILVVGKEHFELLRKKIKEKNNAGK